MSNWYKRNVKTAGSMYDTHARYRGEAGFDIWIPLSRENDEELLNQAFQAAQQAVSDLSPQLAEDVSMSLDPTYTFQRVYR